MSNSSFLTGAVVGSGLVLVALFLLAIEAERRLRDHAARRAEDGRAAWRRRLEAEESKFGGGEQLRQLLNRHHVVLLTMRGCGFCEEQERLLAQYGLAGLVETRVCAAGVPECEGVHAFPTWRVMRGDKFASAEGFMMRQKLLDWLKGAAEQPSAADGEAAAAALAATPSAPARSATK